MDCTNDIYYKIAKKYSQKEIENMDDVMFFFQSLPQEFTEEMAILIYSELTEMLYSREFKCPRTDYNDPSVQYPQSPENQLEFFEYVEP